MKYYNKITESKLYNENNEDVLCNLPAYSFSVMITDLLTTSQNPTAARCIRKVPRS